MDKFIKNLIDYLSKRRFKRIVRYVIKDFNKIKSSFYPIKDDIKDNSLLNKIGLDKTFTSVEYIIKSLVMYYTNKFYKHNPFLKYFDIRIDLKDFSVFTNEDLENEKTDKRDFYIHFLFISNIDNPDRLADYKISKIFLEYKYDQFVPNIIQTLYFSSKNDKNN